MILPRKTWAEMSTAEFAAADTAAWIAVLPVAAIEQHGPHLPVGVDAMIAEGYLRRVRAMLPDDLPATFLPLQTTGKSNEHLAFPGTLTLTAETALRAWTEIGESVRRAGIRKLVIINSHGGNVGIIDIVARDLRVRHAMLAVHASWHRFGYPGISEAERTHGIHAGEAETALMQAFRPELVDMAKARDFRSATIDMERDYRQLRAGQPAGFGWMSQDLNPAGALGNAAAATADTGDRLAEHGARAFVELLRDVHRFPLEALR